MFGASVGTDSGADLTFSAADHHRPLISIMCVGEQLAQGRYMTAKRPGVEPATSKLPPAANFWAR